MFNKANQILQALAGVMKGVNVNVSLKGWPGAFAVWVLGSGLTFVAGMALSNRETADPVEAVTEAPAPKMPTQTARDEEDGGDEESSEEDDSFCY